MRHVGKEPETAFGATRRGFFLGVGATVASRSLAFAAEAPGPRALEAAAGISQLLPSPAPATTLLGFTEAAGAKGVSPGPLLRYRQGDMLAARLQNRTTSPLSLHWQGLRGENGMDGAAPLTQTPVAPGASFDYRRPLPDPGIFCYRPSVFPLSAELVGRGLKGLMIVDEPTALAGDADLALLLDDWKLDEKGELDGTFFRNASAGPIVTVNGAPAPAQFTFAPRARVRLRLANLAIARIMALSFDGVTPYVIAIDSQPCDSFVPVRQTIPVAPGARFELMFDLSPEKGAKARVILRGLDGADRDLLTFATDGATAPGRGPIASLPQNPALPREIKLQESKKVDLAIAPAGAEWTINGAATKGYAGPPLFRVKRGTPVTLGFDNHSDVPLVMHVHGHAVRLLHDLDDGWEPYWRNAIVAPPKKTKHVAFVADSPGQWALHDDILPHEAAGLATWFEVE
ncbi:MAG TPA: multicopper oxidase family protein [Methylocystis sp.]|nr:multicopper oxidase family protein [Methylocystis sp.]